MALMAIFAEVTENECIIEMARGCYTFLLPIDCNNSSAHNVHCCVVISR